ncbi:MAG: hypothetical protein R3F20_04870 [Planctomycetota bacterium]
MIVQDSPPVFRHWVGRFERIAERCETVFEDLPEELWDWSPEEGISSVSSHLFALTEAARSLRADLEDRRDPGRRRLAPEPGLRGCEVARAAAGCLRAVAQRVAEGLATGPGRNEAHEVALARGLELCAHHLAAAAVLLRLADPARPGALRLVGA